MNNGFYDTIQALSAPFLIILLAGLVSAFIVIAFYVRWWMAQTSIYSIDESLKEINTNLKLLLVDRNKNQSHSKPSDYGSDLLAGNTNEDEETANNT